MLVTICVITYNSAKYVEETLESISNQDYKDIEVIISDDCSTDNTRDICERWISENGSKFKRCILTNTPVNSGIAANYNHVWPMACGEWIKFIAGDDRLKPECISSFVAEIESNVEIMCCLRENFKNDTDIRWITAEEHLRKDNQLKAVVTNHYFGVVCGATLFLKKSLLERYCGFDERFMFAEDYPLCMRYLIDGGRIIQVEQPLIEYRNYESVSGSGNPRFLQSHRDAMIEYLPKACKKIGRLDYLYHFNLLIWEWQNVPLSSLKKVMLYGLRLFDWISWSNHFKRH